jgi:hypothetical protein
MYRSGAQAFLAGGRAEQNSYGLGAVGPDDILLIDWHRQSHQHSDHGHRDYQFQQPEAEAAMTRSPCATMHHPASHFRWRQARVPQTIGSSNWPQKSPGGSVGG